MIALPTLPTDNIYKFLFIGGLTLILTGIIVFYTQNDKINLAIDKLEIETKKTKIQSNFLEDDLDSLKIEINTLSKKIKKINFFDNVPDINEELKELSKNASDKNYRDYLEFMFKNRKDVIPYYADKQSLNIKQEELKNKKRELFIKKEIISLQINHLKRKSNDLLILYIISGILILIGIILTKRGYYDWYTLVQKPLDEKIKYELEKLKNI